MGFINKLRRFLSPGNIFHRKEMINLPSCDSIFINKHVRVYAEGMTRDECITRAIDVFRQRKADGSLDDGTRSTVLFVKVKNMNNMNNAILSAIVGHPGAHRAKLTKHCVRKAITVWLNVDITGQKPNEYALQIVSYPGSLHFIANNARKCFHYSGLGTNNDSRIKIDARLIPQAIQINPAAVGQIIAAQPYEEEV